MKYKIFNEPSHAPLEQILINRDIQENKINEWLNAGWPQINSPWLFGTEKVKHAIKLMSYAAMDNKEIYVLVD